MRVNEKMSFRDYYETFDFVSAILLLLGGALMSMSVFGNWTVFIIGAIIFFIGAIWWVTAVAKPYGKEDQ